MNTINTTCIVVLCLSARILVAQSPTPPKIEFLGQTWVFDSTGNNSMALLNFFFPEGQGPGGDQRFAIASFATVDNCIAHVQRLGQDLRNRQPDGVFAIMPDSDADAAVCTMLSQIGENTHLAEVWFFYKPAPEWTSALAKQYVVRRSGPNARAELLEQVKANMPKWGQAILDVKVPTVRLPARDPVQSETEILGGAGRVSGLQVGRPVKVDAEFAAQLKSPVEPPVPFQVVLPMDAENVKINGHPNVPETAVFAIGEGDTMTESVRYTTLSHNIEGNVSTGLVGLSGVVERGFGSSMFGRWGGGVLERYESRIGDNPVAVLIGQSNNADPNGPNFWFKFVAMPKLGTKNGLGIVIMIDKARVPQIKTLADLETKGFAAGVLRSTQFLD